MLREFLKQARPNAELYQRSLDTLPADITGLRGRISALALSPVKSLGMLKITEAVLSHDGIETPDRVLADRMVMIVKREKWETKAGKSYDYVRFSQRENGKLALATPAYSPRDGVLSYVASGMEQLDMLPQDLRPDKEGEVLVRITSAGDVNSAVLENGPITDWVRRYLAQHGESNPDDIFVALQPKNFRRMVEERMCGDRPVHTLYSDGGQLLIASTSTLEWMNDDLRRQYGEDFRGISMDAFRPNIVIEGIPANAEDLIGSVRVDVYGVMGASYAEISFHDPCVRCDVTRVDVAGNKPDAEPLRWLAKNRPPRLNKPNSTTFAINAALNPEHAGSIVRVGNFVEVIREKA